MRYAIFTDIHANLEALEAVLARIDQLALEEPIDQLWFLGDLVGYGPNPNECIDKLRERTDVIIAGNHDWAAVGKIDLEDFSEAARISALWTAEQLSEEHRQFLAELPERLEIDECLLVHGSPYGPLWEYLTSEVLAERSFQYFANRFCFVGHTHVPIIFQQPDAVANTPTLPLEVNEAGFVVTDDEAKVTADEAEPVDETITPAVDDLTDDEDDEDDDETTTMVAVHPAAQAAKAVEKAESALAEAKTLLEAEALVESETLQGLVADAADVVAELQQHIADDAHGVEVAQPAGDVQTEGEIVQASDEQQAGETSPVTQPEGITPQETIANAEERLNEEIEELLSLLGLSQNMISVTNEMIVPPEGSWQAPEGYRAIINPGGVGQPRDGDARAAFMIYDTERGFTFYRVSYPYEKTQEKITKAKLPQYLATRLGYGR